MGTEAVMLGVSSKVLIGTAAGAAIGTVLGNGTWWERVMRGCVGAISAYVGHHVTAKLFVGVLAIAIDKDLLPTVAEVDPVAALFIGIVGMFACQTAINGMTAVRDHADDFVENRLDRGGGFDMPRRRRNAQGDDDHVGEDDRAIPDGPGPAKAASE